MIPFIKDARGTYTAVVDGKSYQFDMTHPNYSDLTECVHSGDSKSFLEEIEVGQQIEDWSDGAFRFESGVLYYVDEEVHRVITARVVGMIKQGFDCSPMLRFLERLYQNPSYRAIHELYEFLEHKALPITSYGHMLAYKAVTAEYMDKWSRTIDNSVGQKPKIPRFRVDDNCNVGCSAGLHVGSIEYVKSYGWQGDKVMIVKIDPANVVSVPLDSDCQKVRCCEYEVVGEYQEDLLPAVVDEYESEEDLLLSDHADEIWGSDDDLDS